ncbi:MAG: thermonuclease family protein [Cytophagales bacterium]|nr:thermonuclease family protein [Armatimonadota bacterium]
MKTLFVSAPRPPRLAAVLAALTVTGTAAIAPGTAAAQAIKLDIPPPPASQSVVPSEVFTGTVKQFVDGETLLVTRDTPDGKGSGQAILIHLYGVSGVPAGALPRPRADAKQERGTTTAVRDLRGELIGKKVRIEVRGNARLRDDRVAKNALVALLPSDASGAAAPPSLVQQGAPSVAIVQSRPLNDAAGVSRDLPRGAAQPNLATSSTVPAPPAAVPVRKDDVLNYALVREGLARWNPREAPDMKEFSEAEEDARKSKRGLWSTGKAK